MKASLFSLVLLSVFGILLFTAYPTIPPYRDSGDLIASSYCLGIAHPPGYPLYVLTGKIFSYIFPFANTAYRINLVSVVFGSLTAAILAVCVFNFTGLFGVSVLSAFLLTISPAFWSLAHVSEMYTLSAFFAALIFFMLLKTDSQPYSTSFIIFIFGLGLGSHPSLVLLAPGMFLYVFLQEKQHITAGYLIKALVLFVLGFSVYLFLLFRSTAQPVLDWGNPENLKNLLRVITRADYGGLKLHPEQSKLQWSAYSVTSQSWLFGKAVVAQFGLAGFVAGIYGIYHCNRKKHLSLLLPAFIFAGLLFFIVANLPVKEATTLPILEPNLVIPNLVFTLFIAYGISSINLYKWKNIFLIIIIFYIGLFNFKQYSKRNHFFAYDYGKNMFFSMPKGAILYDPDDATAFIANYLRICENRRPDIKLFMYFRTRWGYEHLKKMYPDILPESDIPSAQQLMKTVFQYNLGKRDIFVDIVTKAPEGYSAVVRGITYLIKPQGETDKHKLLSQNDNLINSYVYRGEYDSGLYSDFFTQRILYYYASAYNNLGLELAGTDFKNAAKYYKKSIAAKYDMTEAWNNLGSLSFFNKGYVSAIRYFKTALAFKKDDASISYNIGLSYKAAGDYARASEYFSRALQKEYYPNAANELGLLAIKQKDYEKAISTFQELIAKVPSYYYAYYNLGLAYQLKKQYDAAIENYQKYLEHVKDSNDLEETKRLIEELKQRK